MIIKLTKDNFNFRFKQYEGMFFHAEVTEEDESIRYKITKDKEGTELKEFGSTHIKDNMIYVPQIEAYIDLNSIK
ncbi:hypothetical protein IR152_01845 [Clostridioides sp. ES-S-0108-01]|uniref:hypothetical protein n=1 Tax=unclassified Clostridioides TaxID=2635829 RepID=UPI001D0CBA91|nr:hypothetical protein [Clostridioides sp. ES-S-0171-01]MCC0687787.1 hypothetical protein [Clostridioides sp. ES-S-0056-01]MCC0714730.1 hypothetical protein [Clostridioides sp. ES-S-0077-01]MCC0781885.1 hypothetical protein [Clostridioides sp. ES-S-0108-01]UDN49813.1 hypothetical protein JJC16_10500 [Clostridioides sp. ES-S-0107-01]UDN53276.1 hypothetical protein JJC02_10165 [Clostridioides sp. ES-S-0054-01]